MAETGEDVRALLQRFTDAVEAVMRGDVAPMLALWSEGDEATYFDPRGGVHRGREAVVAYWLAAAEANRDSEVAVGVGVEPLAVYAGDALLCLAVVERVEMRLDDAVSAQQARATHVYRREGGDWRLTHRQSEPTRNQVDGDGEDTDGVEDGEDA